jgi:hypothetical protein
MLRKLPRAIRAEVKRVVNGEELLGQVIVQSPPTPDEPARDGALAATRTQLIHVDKAGSRTWPIREVGIVDKPEPVAGRPVTIGILAGEEMLRFAMPSGVPFEHMFTFTQAVLRQETAEMSARIAVLPWWEAKALWPFATKGRVAGGSTLLTPGAEGSLGLGRRGVSFYPAGTIEPLLQFPWPDVTTLYVDDRDTLTERITLARFDELDLLKWALKARDTECFVTVQTKHDELYFAAAAPVERLRFHWETVLDRFAGDPIEEVQEVVASNADLVSRLERLTALHDSGALTDEEFTNAKDALLDDE